MTKNGSYWYKRNLHSRPTPENVEGDEKMKNKKNKSLLWDRS